MIAALTYALFVLVFAIIADRKKFVDEAGKTICLPNCSTKDNWTIKHIEDSWNTFWGASLTCFILGAYVIIGAVYDYNCPDEPQEEKPVH